MLSAPVLHALAVHLPVPDHEAAAAFLIEVLGFESVLGGPGYRELSNGALTLRLVRGDASVCSRLDLEVVTGDLHAASDHLLTRSGVVEVGPVVEVERGRFEQRVATSHGVTLILTRKLTIDELGDLLPVPTTLEWHAEAVRLVQDVLCHVPLEFRPGAHARAARAAEALSLEAGEIEVTAALAASGLLASTPDFKQASLQEELARLGFGGGDRA